MLAVQRPCNHTLPPLDQLALRGAGAGRLGPAAAAYILMNFSPLAPQMEQVSGAWPSSMLPQIGQR